MTLRLNGATSGYTEIDAPAVAGSNTLVLPTGNGTDTQVLATNGSGTLSWVDRGRMVLETQKAASGTSVDFTGIPSWVKRITMPLVTISTNGTSTWQIQVGSGSFSTSGYNAQAWAGSTNSGLITTGLPVAYGVAATWILTGSIVLTKYNPSTEQWIATGIMGFNQAASVGFTFSGYTPVLSGALDRIRLTTVNGTDTFDAGALTVIYEG